jgi:copper chaperone NosL
MNYTHLLLFLVVLGCEIKPQPVDYGNDTCVFCKMTIVDRQHSAELVTTKGRSYKYDAIECMMNDLKKWERPTVELYLVADYANPGTMINADYALFLRSPTIPSPMGEYLSAFSREELLDITLLEHEGKRMNWQELKQDFGIN